MDSKKLIYLAGPYTHEDPKVEATRFKMLSKVAGHLLNHNDDILVFSPISHGYPISKYGKVSGLSEKWQDFNLKMLHQCDELWIVDIEGWEKSKGTKTEIAFAKLNDKKIRMVTPRGRVFRYEEGI